MSNFTVVIPFYNGHATIEALLDCLGNLPVLVVDDVSNVPYQSNRTNVQVVRLKQKGYFSGAVNAGSDLCRGDFLILNQDVTFTGNDWIDVLEKNAGRYAAIGERIKGTHPAWPDGYIHGTFMFIQRKAWDIVGYFDAHLYPLWGSTCEWQLRACRKGYRVLALQNIPDFVHHRHGRFGSSITSILQKEPQNKLLFTHTPPEVSVIVPCYKHGKYLKDLVNSLLGGETSLGKFDEPAFQSFDIIIIDDASPDDTWEYCKKLHNPSKGIKCYRLSHNVGTAEAINSGIRMSTAPYITMLCADDMRKTGSLQALYEQQLKHPHHFIYDGIIAFNKGEIKPGIGVGVSEYNFERLLYKNHIHMGIMMPRKAWEEVGGYPAIMRDGREDWAINIALGIKGWCGYYHKQKGYLYRRENQNRTLTNTTERHYNMFLNKLMTLFPNIYKGERPMACCGKGKPKSSAKNKGAKVMNANKRASIAGAAGMTILEYQGDNYGVEKIWGQSGAQYKYSKTKKRFLAADEDLHTESNKGLLDLREHGRPMFKIVSDNQIQKEKSIAQAKVAPAIITEAEGSLNVDDEWADIDIQTRTAPDILAHVGEWPEDIKAKLYSQELAGKGRKTVLKALKA